MNKFFKRMTAVFLAASTTAASILMPATGIYAAETAATTQNTQAARQQAEFTKHPDNQKHTGYRLPQAPDIVARVAFLLNADTGAILLEKDAHAKGIQPAQLKFLPDFSQLKTVALTRQLHSQVRQPIL